MKTNKILFLFIFLFLGSSFLFSQDALKQGVYNLAGSISYSNIKDTYSDATVKQDMFSFVPEFNYFVIDNLLLGVKISFVYWDQEFTSDLQDYNVIYRMWGIGPNIRYYFPGSIIIPFIGFSANYNKVISTEYGSKSFTAMTGINYFLSNSAAIEPYLAYSISSYEINEFELGIRMSYFILK